MIYALKLANELVVRTRLEISQLGNSELRKNKIFQCECIDSGHAVEAHNVEARNVRCSYSAIQ
eukprot:IDg5485t1